VCEARQESTVTCDRLARPLAQKKAPTATT
jgi:hypothetical protein